jgi:hypothetical protein
MRIFPLCRDSRSTSCTVRVGGRLSECSSYSLGRLSLLNETRDVTGIACCYCTGMITQRPMHGLTTAVCLAVCYVDLMAYDVDVFPSILTRSTFMHCRSYYDTICTARRTAHEPDWGQFPTWRNHLSPRLGRLREYIVCCSSPQKRILYCTS